MSNERFVVGDVIQHFKRETVENPVAEYLYGYMGTARHAETGEVLAIYKALYDSPDGHVKKFDIFVRPYDMFMSEVDHEKYPEIKQKYRFEKYEA